MKARKILVAVGFFLALLFVTNPATANGGYTEEIFQQGNIYFQNNQPYQALEAYTEAYNINPSDARFKEGILKSQKRILGWSLGAHGSDKYSVAIHGYSAILKSPGVDSSLIDFVLKNKYLAESSQKVYGLDNYLNEGNANLKAGQPYKALEIFTEGYGFFNDKRLLEGITKSGNLILSWSKGNHKSGGFNGAIAGYKTLLNNAYISTAIKNEVATLIKVAEKQIKLQTADEYFKQASAISNPYLALDLYEVANAVFPSDKRFVKGVEKNRNTILSWSMGNHKLGGFFGAIKGYERVLASRLLSNDLKQQIERYKIHAANQKILYSKEEILASADSLKRGNPYRAIEIYRDALFLYPNYYTGRVMNEMVECAKIILSWSKTTHAQSGFNSAINGYQTVLSVRHIPDNMYNEATINMEIAKIGIPYNSSGNYIIKTAYDLTLGEMLEKQTTVGAVRSPKQGENGWVKATTEEIRYYADPNEAFKRNFYQYLVLSGISGISVEDLNVILKGKGILEGKGQAFRDAARTYNLNEIYLVNHALLETGHGKSQLANGVVYNGVTVYNMFGIGALDRDPLGEGSKRAFELGWDTPEKAIIGGAKFISERYINHSTYRQDTLYKMRWNPENPATHQYATDIGWAEKQANLIKTYYSSVKNAILRFDIPNFK